MIVLLMQAAAVIPDPPMSLSNVVLGANTLLSLSIVWGGGRLLGKLETELSRTVKLVDQIEERVGQLEGRGKPH